MGFVLHPLRGFPEPIEKPGFCPPSPRGASGPCQANCLHDGNCPEMDKCCSYGCALYCMKPITGETQSQMLSGGGGMWTMSNSGQATHLCQLPSEHGPCDLKLTRWFYNPKTQ
ncbi:hypothetical protein L345_17996, partial [Ophiophagus hannah]